MFRDEKTELKLNLSVFSKMEKRGREGQRLVIRKLRLTQQPVSCAPSSRCLLARTCGL